jgi:hypothetical protein
MTSYMGLPQVGQEATSGAGSAAGGVLKGLGSGGEIIRRTVSVGMLQREFIKPTCQTWLFAMF